MPDDGARGGLAVAEQPSSGRSGRAAVAAFLIDADSEAVLREGLLAAAPEGLIVHRVGSRGASAVLSRMPTPRVLIIDVTDEEQPLSFLAALSEVVEPDVRVLVVGDRQDVDLYRQLTRNLGVAEYLYKPLTAEVVARHFAPFLAQGAPAVAAPQQGGRVITITAACGGGGATTLAASLAWHLAVSMRRHTVLLDPDLNTGTAALLLGAKTGAGLRTMLEAPQRADELFVERIAQPAGDRLAVIAGEEKLTERIAAADGAVDRLLQMLRLRYNYVIADVPRTPQPVYRELLDQARQRVVVLRPTLAAVRDTLRLMALPPGPAQARRALLVLNQLGAPGTLTRHQVEEALQNRIDVAVPYVPRVLVPAATMGTPGAALQGRFRTAVSELAREVAAVSQQPPRGGFVARLLGRFGRGD
jgi:pilus assembly protein CpaE